MRRLRLSPKASVATCARRLCPRGLQGCFFLLRLRLRASCREPRYCRLGTAWTGECRLRGILLRLRRFEAPSQPWQVMSNRPLGFARASPKYLRWSNLQLHNCIAMVRDFCPQLSLGQSLPSPRRRSSQQSFGQPTSTRLPAESIPHIHSSGTSSFFAVDV